jgi:uncharacterized protein
MDPTLHFITLSTADLDAARAFYATGLGWEPLLDVPGEIIFFQVAPGLVLALFDAAKFARDQGMPAPLKRVQGVTLSHNVTSPDDVEATFARLLDSGGEAVKPPRDAEFGGIYHAIVHDPNGITWEIAHNPGWRITADGDVVFG